MISISPLLMTIPLHFNTYINHIEYINLNEKPNLLTKIMGCLLIVLDLTTTRLKYLNYFDFINIHYFHQFYLLKYSKVLFTHCPCTLKYSSFWFSSWTTPKVNTCVTVNRLDHLDLSFPKNNWSFEWNNNTRSPKLNSLF